MMATSGRMWRVRELGRRQLEAISAVATQEMEVEQSLERMTLELSALCLPFAEGLAGCPVLAAPTEPPHLRAEEPPSRARSPPSCAAP